MLPYVLILALSGCIDDDCWGCEEILIVEHHFEPLVRIAPHASDVGELVRRLRSEGHDAARIGEIPPRDAALELRS